MTAGEDYAQHILAAARALFAPGQVVELRILLASSQTASGYFDDLEALAWAAADWDKRGGVTGVYWTINPVSPACLHRSKNKVREHVGKSSGSTTDKEILERRLFLVDIDGADRPSGISATDEEVEIARAKAEQVARFLRDARGFGDPFVGMSGNGYHLLYPIEAPNDQASADAIQKSLNVLSMQFDDERMKIDTSVFNASRISKVYGTMARKGDNTPERPHRRSRFLEKWEG